MRWVEVRVKTQLQTAEAMAMRLIDLGARGAATVASEHAAVVTVHFPDSADAFPMSSIEAAVQSVDDALGLGRSSRLERVVVNDDRWQDAWKHYFKPVRVGRRIVVKPSWENFDPAPGDITIEIDPQMAFGTGLHPTTQLCLRALEDGVRPGHVIADVGTGSGILAIAAVELGASHVDAVDNDDVAVRTAQANVERNGVAGQLSPAFGSGIPPHAGYYDLIIANITGPAAVELAPDALRALGPGGIYLASGFTRAREDEVDQGIEQAGLTILGKDCQEDWLCLHCAEEAGR